MKAIEVNNIVNKVVQLSFEKPTLMEEQEITKKRNIEVAGIENKWIDFYCFIYFVDLWNKE